MWPLRADALAVLVGGELIGDSSASASRLVTDTRAGVRGGDVFLALRGPHFDGGDFVEAALGDGASVVVSTRAVRCGEGQAVVVVPDGASALRALATEARRQLRGTVVGITGSNGKTLVKDLLATALLGTSAWASPMSWNSSVGVPLALLHADPAAAVVLIECGVSRVGEMQRHAELVRPDVGVFVNVGDAHLEGFGSRERIASEKALLFASCDRVFVPEDQPLARAAAARVGAAVVAVPTAGDFLDVDRQLAVAVAVALGVPAERAQANLGSWRPPSMRLELSTTPQGIAVVNDAYTSDPESVVGAIAFLQRQRTRGRAWAVLGGLAQQGDALARGSARVARALVDQRVDGLIGIGAASAPIVDAAARLGMTEVHRVADVDEATRALDAHLRPGDRVLLKGSRPERLERIAATFFAPLAPAVLTVDLDRLVDNYRAIQRLVGGSGVMPVVKANAYGVDPVRVALALEHAGAPHFTVAYPDEGVALREHGVVRPILVQNVVAAEVGKVVGRGLSAQVSAAEALDAIEAEAAHQRRAVRVHLKVDTGMGRAGCEPEQAGELAARIDAHPWLILDGLMTHFAAAEDPASDDYTLGQIARFDEVIRSLPVRPRWIHAANSAGLLRFPQARYDLVRAGLGLWGYGALRGTTHPALRLTTRVVSVKRIPAGRSVGYGRTWSTGDRAKTIAVVALGYADGYPFSASNVGWMAVHGVRCPVVGRVCMDVTMLDVSEVDGVRPGDPVDVFGPGGAEPSLDALAQAAGTIPYELLSRLSARVRRVFESSL